MAKTYVSSTFIDLQEYRAQVERVIRRMGHLDVAMEYYVAEDQRSVDRCLSDVAACDLYIGIFAWRYGWIPTKKNRKKLSITEMEYRQAEKTGKPCLIFLLDGKAPWPPDFIDDDKTQIKRLRNELSEKHSTGPGFKSVDELGRLVAEAIYKSIPAAVPIPEHNLDAYYQALRKRYQTLALEGLTPPQKEEYLQIQLRSVFVEQNVRESPPPVELPKEVWEKLQRDKDVHPEDLPSGITLEDFRRSRDVYYEKPTRPVLDVLTDSRHQQTIILGDPGSGKSTLARYIMLSLIDPTGDEKLRHKFDGYLPLLVELRTYVGLCLEKRCETPLEFFEHLGKTEGWALTKDALHNYLKNDGRAVVIFDGLDEIFDPEQRERVTNQIVGFANDYSKTRIIVTSRIIGYRRKILTDAGFTHFTLQDLDEEQVETFVNSWYDLAMSDRPDEANERQERILKSFQDSPSIRQLAGNPMLLTIMAIIGKHQELPRERWKLYDHAASVLIQHWDVNKHLKDSRVDADFIGEDDKKELLRRLAFKMQRAEGGLAGNYIHRDDLHAEFEGYLIERYSQTPDRAKVIAEAMIQQFRERNFILSLYGANLYGFVHRAFLEYFCASAFVYKFEKTKELTIEQLKTNVYGKHWEDKSWHEILRLIIGMIDEKWSNEIIDFLTTKIYPNWENKIQQRLPWNIALAIQCMSDVRNFNAVARSANNVLESIFVLFEIVMSERFGNFSNAVDYYAFVDEQIIPAVKAIGPNWAVEQKLANWLNGLDYPRNPWFLERSLCEFISQVACGRENIHKIVLGYLSKDESYHVLVPFTLALGWRNCNQTFFVLRDCVLNSKNWNVRQTALSALLEHYRDKEQTYKLLCEWADSSKNWDTRQAAILNLAKHYCRNTPTLPLLIECAEKDKNLQVRQAVLSALAEHFNKNHIFKLLLKWAAEAENWELRQDALIELVEYYPYETETLQVIRERAVNDTKREVRETAFNFIQEKYREEKETFSMLLKWSANSKYLNEVRQSAIYILIKNYPDKEETQSQLLDCAKDNDLFWQLRETAIKALVEYYRDKKFIIELLSQLAVKDQHVLVRQTVIQILAKYHNDKQEILALLRKRAVEDRSSQVRLAAIRAITTNYPSEALNFELLKTCAHYDERYTVRKEAVYTLSEYHSKDAQTLPIIRDRATNDAALQVRRVAVSALIHHFRDDIQTIPLLLERAFKDESPTPKDKKEDWEEYVREIAINAIAKYWPNHPETLPLLEDRAKNDPTPWLRKRAKALIKEVTEAKKQ